MGYVDMAFLGLIGLLSILGFLNGFLKEVLSKVAFIGAIAAAYFGQPFLITFLATFNVQATISSFLLTSVFSSNGLLDPVNISNLATQVSNALTAAGLPASLAQPIIDIANQQVATLAQFLSDGLAGIALNAIGYLAIFVVVFLVLKVITGLFVKAVKKLAGMGFVDRLFGLLFGAFKGLVYCEIAVLSMVGIGLLIPGVNQFITDQITQATSGFSLLQVLYDFSLQLMSSITLPS